MTGNKTSAVLEEMPTGKEKILMVDDEEIAIGLGSRLLRELGYEVTATTSSYEALGLFLMHREEFDLVITDMIMPDVTGARLSQELLALRPDIPIILCSGFNRMVNEDMAKAIGIREFCQKPIGRRQFARIVRKVLDESKADIP